MADRITFKVSGVVSIMHAPAESPNAAASAQLDLVHGAAESIGTVRKVVKSAAFVSLGWPVGLVARDLYLKPCCGGAKLTVRLTLAVSGQVEIPIAAPGLLLLTFPADDALTGVEASSGSDSTAIDVEWFAVG